MKLTKIIGTIGPVTRSREQIIALYQQGVNVIRLNFSHKDYDEKKMVIDIIHELNQKGITKLAILLDTKGPEIRTGYKVKPSCYIQGQIIKVTTNIQNSQADDIFCDYPYLLEDLQIGDIIKIDSGLFDVKVEKIESDHCVVSACQDGSIGSYRHINLPGKRLKLEALSHQDQEDLLFGIEHGIHIIAMSFVRSAQDIFSLKKFWVDHGGGLIDVFAKIENMQGIDNLESIIQASDGIMVARGDLGIEADISMIPVYQKQIVSLCHYYFKPVIIATQMIESMIQYPLPTRAEIQDISYAVSLGVDAVMLSGETAIGKYPLQAVHHMYHTIQVTEQHNHLNQSICKIDMRDHKGQIYAKLIQSAVGLANDLQAQAIIIFTKTGTGAKILSAYKPSMPCIACTRDDIVSEQLLIYYALYSLVLENKISDLNHKGAQKIAGKAGIKGGLDSSKPYVLISDVDVISGYRPSIQIISATNT